MNEDFINELYQFSGGANIGTYDEFVNELKNSKDFQQELYNAVGGSTVGTYDEFLGELGLTTPSPVPAPKPAPAPQAGPLVVDKEKSPIFSIEGTRDAMAKVDEAIKNINKSKSAPVKPAPTVSTPSRKEQESFGYSWETPKGAQVQQIKPPKPQQYVVTETPITKQEADVAQKKADVYQNTKTVEESIAKINAIKIKDFTPYENTKVDVSNLTPEQIQARDDWQQFATNTGNILESSKYLLKNKYGDNVEKDIQDIYNKHSILVEQLNELETKVKNKFSGSTPSDENISPLTDRQSELSDKISELDLKKDEINSKSIELNKSLEALANKPGVTEQEYNYYYQQVSKQFEDLSKQFDQINADQVKLVQDYEEVRLKRNALIKKYDDEFSDLKSKYAADSDVKNLKFKLKEYEDNWGKIEEFKKDPYFNTYIDSLTKLNDLGKTYKNLFPDLVQGEEKSKELAKLAQTLVYKDKAQVKDYSQFLSYTDVFNGIKSIFTDAPATGIVSTAVNALKGATYNIAGDFLASASAISDLLGAENLARKIRVGDLYGATVTRMNIEQNLTKQAVRSDIVGNGIENFYLVKDNDTNLFSTGLQPGDKIIIEDGKPVMYRGEDGFKKSLNQIPGTNPDKVVADYVKDKKEDWDFDGYRLAVSSLPTAIDMISLMAFNYSAAPRLLKLFTSPTVRKVVGLASNAGVQTFQQFGDVYSSYLQQGKSPGDAGKFALGQSAGVALMEILNPLEMKVASLGDDIALNSYRKAVDTSVDLFARGKIGFKDSLLNIASAAQTFFGDAGKEILTEEFQGRFENTVENYALNKNKSWSFNDSVNSAVQTLAVVGGPSIMTGAATYFNGESDIITSSIFKSAQNKEQFFKDLDQAVGQGKLEIDEAAGLKGFVEYIKDELDEYGTITDNQGAALTGLIGTRYYLENKRKSTTNETAKKEIDKKIEELNTNIQAVLSGEKKPKVDPFVAEFVGEKRRPTKNEFTDFILGKMPKDWQDMSMEDAWNSFQELSVDEQTKFARNAGIPWAQDSSAAAKGEEGETAETPVKEDINTKKAYDFDDTLFDNKTGKLTTLGEDVKKRIEAGEDIVIVTARGENQTQQIQDVLGIGADKIEATGDEAKKPEALQKRGISPQEYYDENQEKLAAIQGVAAPSTTAAGAMTKEQQAELDKVTKRAERIQRTLQEDAAVQEEGDEPLLTAEQKKILETELQTLNQRRDAIQKQSTAEVPIQPGTEGGPGVGGQVQAKPEGPAGKVKGKGKEVEGEKAGKVTNVSIGPPLDEDGEVDYEAEDAVRQIAKSRNLGITRDREIASVARDENGNIVGGAFTSYDDTTGEYTFDVVVSEDYDGTGIGSKLLDSVINLPSDIKDMNPKAKVKVDVVNPRMKNMLEQRGFKVTKKIGDDRFIMEPSKKTPQATKAAEPTPTTTPTEKVSPEAAKAPQKPNTVQGFEITRKDGSKLPASDYTKDKKTGKWKRVAADGTTKGVSFAPYVKQLEDALSSQSRAAAETKKTEPTPTEVAETPVPKNKVRASFNIENAGRLKTIQTTPAFKNIFSEEQLKNLKVGENTVDLNMTAWGKAQRMLDAKDLTKKTEPTPAVAAQTSKAQRIIDEQKKATQLSKEISKKIKDIMSLSKSMFNRFGVKTRVVDKKTLQEEIRAKFKDLAFSRTGAPVISATKPEGKISEKDFKDLKNLADELGFTLSATRNKTYAVYLDNLTGTIYYNSEADITNPVKNLQDLYDVNSVADLNKRLNELLPEGIELMNLGSNESSFYIAIPDLDIIQNYKDLVNFDKLSEILFEDPKNLDRDLEIIRKYASDFDWFQLSYNPNLNPTPEMLREFKDKWDWYGISSNPSLKSTPEMLREFKDEWHWDRLSRYQNIDLEMLKEFKDEWSWYELSQKPNLNPTPEMLRELKDEWHWSSLSRNPSLNPSLGLLKEFKDEWSWGILSGNPSLNPTVEMLKEFKDEWSWGNLSQNPSLNPTVEMLKEFKDEWSWIELSRNPSLNPTVEMLKEFKDEWIWGYLSGNPSLNPTFKLISKFRDKWDWSILSYNSNLNPTPLILRGFEDKWDWYSISSNPSLKPTPEMLREFKGEWNWSGISYNPNLNPTPEMLREFKDKWDWYGISSNPNLNPTPEMLREFKDELDWSDISQNPSLNPTVEMLKEFKDEWDWIGISGHKNFNITKEIAEEYKDYINWLEVSRMNKLKPWHLDYIGIGVKTQGKAKFTKLSSVGLPAESVRHYFPLFTGRSPERIVDYWAETWKSGLTTVESATTNPDLINSDIANDHIGGGFVVFSNDSNFLFYSPEDNYSFPTETKKTKGPKNLKYATRSEAIQDPNKILNRISSMDQKGYGRDEWIIELSPANIDYIQFNLKEDKVKIRELTSNGLNIWEDLSDEVNSFAITTFVSYLENYTYDKETFLLALEDLGMDAFDKRHPQHEDGKKVYQYLRDLVINDKIDNFSGNIKVPDFLQKLNDEFGIEIRLTSPDGKKTTTLPRRTINTFLSKSGGEVWGFYDNKLKEAVLRSDAPMEATVHEAFTHPFLEAAKVQNPKLYNSLLKQAAAKKEIKESVDKDYKDKTKAERNDEYIARAIDKYVKGELDAIKDKGLIKAILDFFKNISDNLKSFLDLPTSVKDISPNTTLKELAQYSLYGKGTIDLRTQPAPSAAEVETKATTEAKTAEELSADIQADIEAEAAKEQEAIAKAFEGNKKQKAANDLIKNPKSAETLPQDLLEELYNLAAEAKYTPALKKKCD